MVQRGKSAVRGEVRGGVSRFGVIVGRNGIKVGTD